MTGKNMKRAAFAAVSIMTLAAMAHAATLSMKVSRKELPGNGRSTSVVTVTAGGVSSGTAVNVSLHLTGNGSLTPTSLKIVGNGSAASTYTTAVSTATGPVNVYIVAIEPNGGRATAVIQVFPPRN